MSGRLAVGATRNSAAWLELLPVLVGLSVLYVPSFYDLASWHWQQEEGGHGPIILAIVVWLLWQKRAVLMAVPQRTAPVSGFALLTLGLLLYVAGRSQEIALFEVGALVPILAGALLAMRGWPGLRALWFPVLYVAFMVPLPGLLIDELTGPLKQHVSAIAERLLYAAGYPVARDGVILTLGQYQLLVADACSGLHSIFSLSALGVLFIYLTPRANYLHNAVMLASIVPIAFIANVARVLILMLITYHFGDKAGQSFLHRGTGIASLLSALIILILLDALLARAIKPRTAP